MDFAGDDDLGGPAIRRLGKCLQPLQLEHLVGGIRLGKHPQRLRLGLLHQGDRLRFTLGLPDLLLLDALRPQNGRFLLRLGPQDSRFLFPLGHQDLAVLFTLRPQDGFPAFPFRLHLFFHGVLDLPGRQDVFQLHPVDLDPPFVGGFIQGGRNFCIDDIPGGEGAVQFHLANDIAQRGGGEVFNGGHRPLHPIGKELGIGDLVKNHRIDLHGHIVPGDHRLGGKIHHLFLQRDLPGNPIEERDLKVQPIAPGGMITAQPLHHIDRCLRDDFNVGNQNNEKDQ